MGCLSLTLLVVALYGRTSHFDVTRTDDKVLLSDDSVFLQDAANLTRVFGRPFFPGLSRGEAYYRPVVTASFILDAQGKGIQPGPFHRTNVALHALVVCLLWILLGQLGFGSGESWLAAAVFAVHPALTEAVVWIPGRCDLLLGVGVFASLLSFIQYCRTRSGRWLLAHLLAFAFALFSKEAAVALPVALASWGLWVEGEEGLLVLKDRRVWLGWFVVACGWLTLRLAAVGGAGGEPLGDRVDNLIGHLPVLLMHLGKTLLPFNLAVLASVKDTRVLPGLIALGAVGMTAVLLRERRLFLWGIAFWALFLLPSLPVSDFLILENRLYVPAFGAVLGTLVAINALLARLARPTANRLAGLLGSAVVVLCFVQSWGYSESFREPHAFTDAAVRTSPHLGLAHLNHGIVLQLDDRLKEAESEYQAALSLDPTLTVTHNNLGLIRLNRGDLAAAEALFRQEIAINPGYDKAFFNLGLALARLGRRSEATAAWRDAVRLNPGNDEARAYLEAAGAAPTPAGSQPPVGATAPADLGQIPTDVLQHLYEDALRNSPGNSEIRRAYADLCKSRGLACGKDSATPSPPK